MSPAPRVVIPTSASASRRRSTASYVGPGRACTTRTASIAPSSVSDGLRDAGGSKNSRQPSSVGSHTVRYRQALDPSHAEYASSRAAPDAQHVDPLGGAGELLLTGGRRHKQTPEQDLPRNQQAAGREPFSAYPARTIHPCRRQRPQESPGSRRRSATSMRAPPVRRAPGGAPPRSGSTIMPAVRRSRSGATSACRALYASDISSLSTATLQ